MVTAPRSRRIQWGRVSDGLHWLCHRVVRDPSSTLAAALPLCASLAVAVHPVRASTGMSETAALAGTTRCPRCPRWPSGEACPSRSTGATATSTDASTPNPTAVRARRGQTPGRRRDMWTFRCGARSTDERSVRTVRSTTGVARRACRGGSRSRGGLARRVDAARSGARRVNRDACQHGCRRGPRPSASAGAGGGAQHGRLGRHEDDPGEHQPDEHHGDARQQTHRVERATAVGQSLRGPRPGGPAGRAAPWPTAGAGAAWRAPGSRSHAPWWRCR